MTRTAVNPLREDAEPLSSGLSALQLRRRPLQRRGQVTFNRVLDAAEQILLERGILALTTNLIAARSGVNISSIYKFFPNKHSVVLALFERHLKIRVDHVRDAVVAISDAADWRPALDAAVERSYEARQLAPSTIVVLRAMLSSQELYEVDQATRGELAALFASALKSWAAVDDARIHLAARCLVETSIALLNFWQSTGDDKDPRIVEEAKTMARSYLAAYLRPPPR
jgi:AcrR family transcriptional regulator